jgi:hypothetical protein
METIRNLLPNEHVLNFYEGKPMVPEWLSSELKIILGAGDLDQEDSNLVYASMFDVLLLPALE